MSIKLEYKADFERAQNYWDAFWSHSFIDRPCTIITADGDKPKGSIPRLQPIEADFNIMVSEYDKYLKSHHFLGECIPGFRPGFGPDQFAGFLGAPIKVDPNSKDTSWSVKIVEDWKEFLPLEIDYTSPCWQRMHEFHEFTENYFREKCLIYEIDLHSNIDGLEALRGAQKLLFDLIDTPEIIQDAMSQIRPIHQKVYEAFYKYGNKSVLGTNSTMGLYNRKRTTNIQADFICLMTPEMVRKHVLPALEEEACYLDNSCFHLDGPGSLAYLDDILSIKQIQAVQWLPGEGTKPQHEWPEVLHKIQKAGKAIILYADCELVKVLHKEYNPELVAYCVHADSIKQAEDLLKWLKENS
jgi:hypothetical protein